MNYRIEKTGPFYLFGASIELSPEDSRFTNIFDKLGLYTDEVLENGSHDATNTEHADSCLPPICLSRGR